jgi:hypothetical protein
MLQFKYLLILTKHDYELILKSLTPFSNNSENLNESLEKVYNWYIENQKENLMPNENKKQVLKRNKNMVIFSNN